MTHAHMTIPFIASRSGDSSAATVESALRQTKGVLRAVVNSATEMAYVEFDAEQCSETSLKQVVGSATRSMTADIATTARRRLTNTWRWRIAIAAVGLVALAAAVFLHALTG